MTEEAMFLIIYLVIITLLCILIYVINRGQLSICELRRTLDEILAGTRRIEAAQEHQRRVLNDAHKKITVLQKAKKPRKTCLLNPTN